MVQDHPWAGQRILYKYTEVGGKGPSTLDLDPCLAWPGEWEQVDEKVEEKERERVRVEGREPGWLETRLAIRWSWLKYMT